MAKDKLQELTDELIWALDGTTEKPRNIPVILREIEGIRGDRPRPFLSELREQWYIVARSTNGDFERERRRLVDDGLASPTAFDEQRHREEAAAVEAGRKDAEQKRAKWAADLKANAPAVATRQQQLEEAIRRADVVHIG